MKAKQRFQVGERVKFKADYLRATGQVLGGEGHKVWTVLEHAACELCSCGSHVAVERQIENDEPGYTAYRHIAGGNLQRVGEIVVDRLPQAGFLKHMLPGQS